MVIPMRQARQGGKGGTEILMRMKSAGKGGTADAHGHGLAVLRGSLRIDTDGTNLVSDQLRALVSPLQFEVLSGLTGCLGQLSKGYLRLCKDGFERSCLIAK